MALMPAPPMPTMWMRSGARRSRISVASAGMSVHQLGHAGRRVGVAQSPGRRRHRRQSIRVGQQRLDLGRQAVRRALGVGNDDGRTRPPPTPPHCGSGGHVAHPARARGWRVRPLPAARPPSWRPPGRHRGPPRRRPRAFAPRMALPDSAVPRRPGGCHPRRSRAARTGEVAPTGNLIDREIRPIGPRAASAATASIDPPRPERAPECRHRAAVRRQTRAWPGPGV